MGTQELPATAERQGRPARIVIAVMAMGMQLVVLVPFTVASGLLAPLWAVITFHVLWLGFAVALGVLLRRRSRLALAVPLLNAAVLWAGIALGESLLGWTA
jgi:hypothetical protein